MWPTTMHEPLPIGILNPFIRVDPWQLHGTPQMPSTGRQLCQVFKEMPVNASNLQRKFWARCVDLTTNVGSAQNVGGIANGTGLQDLELEAPTLNRYTR